MISFFWNNVLIDPMTNGLIALDHLLFGNFGLAIIAFTIIIRAATFPLTIRQLHSTRAMTELQPQIKEIQRKYKDPKRRNEETMRLYRESGVNPIGCIFPMLIQFPIWIALYQVVRLALAGAPENYIDLADRLYSIDYIQHAVPVGESFLWLNLGEPDIVLPVLVGASMWIQQKSSMSRNPAAAGSQQAQMNSTMLWMMPLMFTWFSLTVPSGLALYWFSTNVIGIVLNGFVFGFETLHPMKLLLPASAAPASVSTKSRSPRRSSAKQPAQSADDETEDTALVAQEGESVDGPSGSRPGSKRKNRRRSR